MARRKQESDGGDTRIVVFYCQHTVSDLTRIDPITDRAEGLYVKPVMLTCSSKIQVSHLLAILDGQAEGVEVVACPKRGCRFLTGSTMAEKRIIHARGLLEEIGVSGERLGISWKSGLSADALVHLARLRARAIQELDGKEGNA